MNNFINAFNYDIDFKISLRSKYNSIKETSSSCLTIYLLVILFSLEISNIAN